MASASDQRPFYIRVLWVSPPGAKKKTASVDDAHIVMATTKETLTTQLQVVAKDCSSAEIFPSCDHAANEKRLGLPLKDFVDLFFGNATDMPWQQVRNVLSALGYEFLTAEASEVGMDVVMRVSQMRKGASSSSINPAHHGAACQRG